MPKTPAKTTVKPKTPTSKPTKKLAKVLSLHAHQAEKAHKHAQTLEIRHKQLLSAAQENAIVAETIFTAVLGLIRCRTLPQLRTYLQSGFQKTLNVQAARLILPPFDDLPASPITLTPLNAEAHRPYFGPKTSSLKSVCLLTLEVNSQPLGMLALGSSSATRFHAGQGTYLAEFLRQALSEVLHNLHG